MFLAWHCNLMWNQKILCEQWPTEWKPKRQKTMKTTKRAYSFSGPSCWPSFSWIAQRQPCRAQQQESSNTLGTGRAEFRWSESPCRRRIKWYCRQPVKRNKIQLPTSMMQPRNLLQGRDFTSCKVVKTRANTPAKFIRSVINASWPVDFC